MRFSALPQVLLNGAIAGSLYAMLAAAWGLIFSTTKTFHFAFAVSVAGGGYAAYVVGSLGAPVVAVIAAAIVAGVAIGLFAELLIYQPLRRRQALPLNIFLAALGTVIAGEAILEVAFGPRANQIAGFEGGGINRFGVFITRNELITVIASWLTIFALVALLKRSQIGRMIRGVTSNLDLARAVGIPARSVYLVVFVIGSAVAGLGGFLYGDQNVVTPGMGLSLTLSAAIGVFLGGVGSMKGAVVGGMLLGIAENIGGIGLPSYFNVMVGFILLIAVLIFRPVGLFGQKLRAA